MILAERSGGRRELVRAIEEWLNGLLEEASDFEVEVREGADSWITITPDEELVETMIRLQVRIDPISLGKPPYTARVEDIAGSRIVVEHPSPGGVTVRRALSASSFAAGLGYGGDKPMEFLESVGIFEGAPMSISAGMPSIIQLELLAEQVMRGLDRIIILNAAIGEVDELVDLFRNQIAHHEHLTLSVHMLYLRLGTRLDKLVNRLRQKLPGGVTAKPLPWSQVSELLESGSLCIRELLERIVSKGDMGRVGFEPTTSAASGRRHSP
jgi:hypothetical protein